MIERAQTAHKERYGSFISAEKLLRPLLEAAMGESSRANSPQLEVLGDKYRPENIPWHDRLETVLNDPEDKVAIQRALEWAERSVSAKMAQQAPSKRAG